MQKSTKLLHQNQNALKDKVTQSSILSHRMALDIMFLMGEKAIIIENDAVNCYDRILTNVASLALLRMGMAVDAVKFFLKFLETAVHHLVLGGTPSIGTYTHRSDPDHGKWTGNRMVPAVVVPSRRHHNCSTNLQSTRTTPPFSDRRDGRHKTE